MVFTTPTFLIFLAIVFAGYWSLHKRGQNLWILFASFVFYGWWDWRFLGLLVATAGIDYAVALALAAETRRRRRKALLGVSLFANLGTLALFKYADFFISSFQQSVGTLGVEVSPFALRLILPLGISFYTFQALGYTIDVYRGRVAAVRSPIVYFAFITFFPQLVAGPIERATNLLRQFERERTFEEERAIDGARQMLWGFFKKMVVADNLAPLVAAAYGDVGNAGSWQLLWATYAFAFQIYCDFSGYTDIAIGCARWFGFDLMRNFAYPYFSRDIPEFWRRWHISLSTWFRDYVYIPLGGSRVSGGRRLFNVLALFAISGFWHGANWTFVVWGLLHGVFYYVFMTMLRPAKARAADVPGGDQLIPRIRDVGLMLATFHIALLAWIFFRAASVGDAVQIISKMATGLLVDRPIRPPAAFGFVAILLLVEWLQRDKQHGLAMPSWPRPLRHVVYYAVVLMILVYANLAYTPFIYFQF